jgi:putative ABC transport system ATP-binding protein
MRPVPVLHGGDDEPADGHAGQAVASAASVQLSGIRRSFVGPGRRTIVALEVPDLRLAPGDFLGITGPNGSGKTTLLHLVAGLLRPDEGTVEVAGQDLGRLSEHQLDRFRIRNIGYLAQEARLLEGLSAERNVMMAMLFAGRPPREQRARARALLDRFGVSHRARHLPHAMSGGERQRVALARALANDPPVVLADEPTTSLDAPAARRLVADLRNLCRDEQRTVLLVTHHPEQLWACNQELHLETSDPTGSEE